MNLIQIFMDSDLNATQTILVILAFLIYGLQLYFVINEPITKLKQITDSDEDENAIDKIIIDCMDDKTNPNS
jgi:hypothetical protein